MKHPLWAGLLLAIGSLAAACGSTSDADSRRTPAGSQSELLLLPIEPAENAVSGSIVPVDIQAPCLATILQGAGPFGDVGWMSPRFLATAPYEFAPMPSGGSRFRASFRTPRSEADAVRLWGGRDRERFPLLYCDIAGTFRWLSDTPVRRLAAWPVPSIRVMVGVSGDKIDMTAASPDWISGGELVVSTELTRDQTASLQRDLRSELGAQLIFIVSNRPRLPACIQSLDLRDAGKAAVTSLGLQDGTPDVVALATLRALVAKLPRSASRVSAEGDCGSDSVLAKAAPERKSVATCALSGTSLKCRTEGALQDGAMNIQSNAIIGDQVGGAY